MSPSAVPHPPAVVINADDLGISLVVNRAILASLSDGLVTSATIMANMPGFADACESIETQKLHDRIGVHLNLTDGMSLSTAIRRCPRLCDPDGQLRRRRRSVWRLSKEEKEAVETELRAQVDAVLAAGIHPSHLDSHHHVHTQWPIATIVMRIARERGISAIRLTRNCGPRSGPLKRAYKDLLNARLRRAGLAPTRYFGSARDAASLADSSGPIEIMVHPSLDIEGRLIDLTDGSRCLEEVLSRWQAGGRLVTYRELQTPSPARGDR